MAKLLLALCFMLLGGCFAFSRQQPQENECQFQRLNTLKPDNRIESEGGFIETWNPNNQQFRCAGVALSRCTLQRNALRRPFYSNAPQEIFIQQGSGYFGLIFPGCSGTFEEPQESQKGKGQSQRPQDRHQKVQRFRGNDVIAVPTGVAFWMYNDQDTPVVAVSAIDTSSNHNQLDRFPRRFYLAGNQEQEFLQYQQQQGGRQSQQQGRQTRPRGQEEGQEGSENEGGNIFAGFAEEFLSQAFQVDREIVRNLQGAKESEEKGAIVTVKGGLSILSPPERRPHRRPEQEEDEDEDEDDEPRSPSPRGGRGRGGADNGLEETICTASVKKNIGKSTSPDVYNPQAGSIRTLNNLDLPILTWLGLSAEFGSLRRNAMFVPHYNLNANSIIYALNGRAYVQVVDCSGNAVFDGELQEGQVLIVPQNFAVAAKSLSEHFVYVSFKTNARPSIANLAGGNSLIGQLPVEVVAQSFGLRTEQARQIKLNNPFKFLVPPRESEMRAAA